ncbi:MoaF-related domain-containing protein [Pseudaminobacter soli (ex Li et al. 2025)]|uniref:Adenylate cyclase n=1 Tax=Pseudaminobacter soli (ex Li et al. 2025) TaxID=1295366 RepID=A0A2P7S0S7_9HYPH|nr:adenylate cyclase [Mesorhizobium soli]PSJ56081.1 adenylate cyclase [Mesorhizobium soli]
MNSILFPMAGGRFEVDYGDLVATNDYARDGQALTYEITKGELTGNTATVGFEWRHLSGQSYAISWQEADGSTVVHIDDFEVGRSLAFFTTPDGTFFRLEGSLRPFAGAGQH